MSHASLFFASYEYFNLNQDVAPTKEFLRLKQLNGWKNGDGEYAEACQRFADALAEDFNAMYGTDINNIDHWHALCHILGIDPVPEGISACRKVRMWANRVNVRSFTFYCRVGCQVKTRQPCRFGLPLGQSRGISVGPSTSQILEKAKQDIPEGICQGWRDSSLPFAPHFWRWRIIQRPTTMTIRR